MEKKGKHSYSVSPPPPIFQVCIEWNTLEQWGAGHGVSSKRNISRWDSIPPRGIALFSFCEHVVKFNSLSVKTAASWKHRGGWKRWALWRASIWVCAWCFLDSLYQPLPKGRGAQVVGNLLILLFKNVMSEFTFWWACCILYLLFIYTHFYMEIGGKTHPNLDFYISFKCSVPLSHEGKFPQAPIPNWELWDLLLALSIEELLE